MGEMQPKQIYWDLMGSNEDYHTVPAVKHGGGGWCDMGLTNGSMKNLAEEEFSNMTGTP